MGIRSAACLKGKRTCIKIIKNEPRTLSRSFGPENHKPITGLTGQQSRTFAPLRSFPNADAPPWNSQRGDWQRPLGTGMNNPFMVLGPFACKGSSLRRCPCLCLSHWWGWRANWRIMFGRVVRKNDVARSREQSNSCVFQPRFTCRQTAPRWHEVLNQPGSPLASDAHFPPIHWTDHICPTNILTPEETFALLTWLNGKWIADADRALVRGLCLKPLPQK